MYRRALLSVVMTTAMLWSCAAQPTPDQAGTQTDTPAPSAVESEVPVPMPGRGQFAFRMFGGADDPDRVSTDTIDHYSFYMLSPYHLQIAEKVRFYNPSAKIYMYKDASSMRRDQSDPFEEWCSSARDALTRDWGVDYCQAETFHPDWFLTVDGEKFEYSGYQHHWHADVGANGYEQQWADNVINDLKSDPVWDGVLVDNQLNDITFYVPGARFPDQYSSIEEGQAAYKRFIDYVSQRVTGSGFEIISNMGAHLYPGLWDRYAEHQSGGYDEWWTTFIDKDGAPTPVGSFADDGWRTQIAELDAMVESGKTGIFNAQTANGKCSTCAEYGYASYLLGNDGKQYFMEGAADAQMTDWVKNRPMYMWDLGDATSGRTEIQGDGSKLFQRTFMNGIVLVNTDESTTRTVELDGTYLDETGAEITSVEIGPLRAVVLRKPETQSASSVR